MILQAQILCLLFACRNIESFPAKPSLSNYRKIKLEDISFDDLFHSVDSIALQTKRILSTTGILKITDIPDLVDAQYEVFKTLSSCLLENYESSGDTDIFKTIMDDGRTRLTIGAKTISGHPEPITNLCGRTTARLRSTVDLASRQLFKVLDAAAYLLHDEYDSNYVMEPYHTFEDLIKNGDHLEHFHAYYHRQFASNDSTDVTDVSESLTMKMHTGKIKKTFLIIHITTNFLSFKKRLWTFDRYDDWLLPFDWTC